MCSNILNDQNCVEILRKKYPTDDIELVSHTVEPFSKTMNGFLGGHFRGIVEILQNGETKKIQLFIKQLQEDAVTFDFIEATGAYVKETFLYETVIGSETRVDWAPQFFMFKDKKDLILEDKSQDGFQMTKMPFGNYDEAHCKVTLKALASLHAYSINFEHQKLLKTGKQFNFAEEYPEIFRECLYNADPEHLGRKWVDGSINGFVEIYKILPDKQIPIEDFLAKIEKIRVDMAKWVQPWEGYQNCILHGDVWFKNLLYKYNGDSPEKCVLIDFQILRYSVPTLDVLMFLFINTNKSFCDAHLDDMLQYYHEQLTLELRSFDLDVDTILPWSQFMETVPTATILAQLTNLVYKTFLLFGDEFFNSIATDADKYREFLFGNRTNEIVHIFKENPYYQLVVTEELGKFVQLLNYE